MDENMELQRKRKKIVERLKKPSISLDATEKLIADLGHHMGIASTRTFSELSSKEKAIAGRHLQNLLGDVSDGALTPLMHYTLNAQHIRKLADIKQISGSLVKDHLGIGEGRSFTSMSEVEKDEVGSNLIGLLKQVSGGALVPLLNSALNSEEVKKLASLKDMAAVTKPVWTVHNPTAVSSEAWAKLSDWTSVAGRGRLLLSGSVAHASLITAVQWLLDTLTLGTL